MLNGGKNYNFINKRNGTKIMCRSTIEEIQRRVENIKEEKRNIIYTCNIDQDNHDI